MARVAGSAPRTVCRQRPCPRPPAQGWGGYCAEHGSEVGRVVVGDPVRDAADHQRTGRVLALDPAGGFDYAVRWATGETTLERAPAVEPLPRPGQATTGRCRSRGCRRHGEQDRHGYCDLHYGPALCDCDHAMDRHDPGGDRPCADCSCINPEIVPYEEEAFLHSDDGKIEAEIRATEKRNCRPDASMWVLARQRARELGLQLEWDVRCHISGPGQSSGTPTVMERVLEVTVKPRGRASYSVSGHLSKTSGAELMWRALLKQAGVLKS